MFATLFTVLVLLPGTIHAQSGSASPQAASAVLDPIQGAWNADELERTTDAWRAVCADESHADLTARFNLFRSERNAALAHGKGELKAGDREALIRLSSELQRTAPQSFEAHMAEFYLGFPSAQAFDALQRAAIVAGDRPELLGPQLADAVRRNSAQGMKDRANAMKARGGIVAGFMQAADDLLLSVEPNAVLFVAGEMDAYPVWVRQYAEGKRKDLLVIDVRLLEDANYRRTSWATGGAKGAVPGSSTEFLTRFVASGTNRPVYLSLALGPERLALFSQETYAVGLALKYSKTPVENIPLLEQRWSRFSKPLTAGPLSRNYLLPASILLQHYRSTGNEAKASQMELELRRFATAIKSTSVLYTLGILEH
ncbi:MAG: hypothetical protein WEC15_00010 [Flavobacteriales bacterium]